MYLLLTVYVYDTSQVTLGWTGGYTHPLGQVQLVGPVQAQDGVEVPGRPVEVVFPLLKRVGVTQLLQTCKQSRAVLLLLTIKM